MNKADLISNVAAKADLTKADAKKAVEAFTESVSEALASKESVQLVGFGTFTTVDKPARTGRNPQTGASIEIAAKTVAKFKPGKGLTDKL